jgi:hypothetical protein
VPEHAVDGRSLAGLATSVVSAGGTMIREAAVLGNAGLVDLRGPARCRRRAAHRGRPRPLPARSGPSSSSEKAPAVRERAGRPRSLPTLLRLAVPIV